MDTDTWRLQTHIETDPWGHMNPTNRPTHPRVDGDTGIGMNTAHGTHTQTDMDRHTERPLDGSPETETHRSSHLNTDRHSDTQRQPGPARHTEGHNETGIQKRERATCSCTSM